MANIKDFIKKIGDESVSLEEQQQALAQVEKTIVEAKAKREESIGKNVDLVISALKNIESKLESKLVELNNTPAKQGVQGQQGPAGRDGRDGKDGYTGRDGKDGVDGKDGKDGEDGVSVADAQIDFDGSLLITLSDGREIDAGTVIPLDVAKQIHSVSTNGGGTSQPVLDALDSLQSQINTLTGVDGVLGDMAQQNANAVAITGGSITGITDLAIADGGTGASNASGARTNLGLGTISIQDASAVAVTGGTINNTVIGGTTPAAGTFTTLGSTGTATLASGSTTYVTITGDASYPMVKATGGTNTPLVLSPLGTGALQAQKTDSSATGGNARGANAVDWQTARATAAQVTSGQNSVINGGQNNIVGGAYAVVGGGRSNSGGSNDTVVCGGASNTAGGGTPVRAAIVGGNGNIANGYYNFIGGGYINAGTSFTAVTTNTTTIALTTATTVYLSSVNASIKVGAYITGTGVSADTYATSTVTTGTAAVMATSSISGTTLTVGSVSSGTIIAGMVLTGTGVTAGTYIVSGSGLSWVVSTSQTVSSTTITGTAYTFTISQAATTAAGVTLSFYTPHGVVVGGGNNQATGSYSFIGGGGDAGTAANRNVASGDWSTVGGGIKNLASGNGATIAGGGLSSVNTAGGNTASGAGSFISGGQLNQATNTYSVAIGASSISDGNRSLAFGHNATTRGLTGFMAFSPCATPVTTTNGINQAGLLILARQTTDATATVLASDANAASGTNQVILPNNSAYYFRGELVAGVTGGGNTKGWSIEGVIKRGAGVGTTAIVGTATVVSTYADAGAATWAVTATADTTNGGLKITVTGQAATTIRWVAQIRTTEMTY